MVAGRPTTGRLWVEIPKNLEKHIFPCFYGYMIMPEFHCGPAYYIALRERCLPEEVR
jgi:hypothetical protein